MKRQYVTPLVCEAKFLFERPINNLNTGSHIDQTIDPEPSEGYEGMAKERRGFYDGFED